MTISSRAARGVRKVRAQLRDLAAAEHGRAASTSAAAATAVATEHASLVDTTAAASVALAQVTSVHTFDQIGDLLASQRASVISAEAAHAAANAVTDLAAVRLRARIRQLKTVERVVELIDRERTTHEAKTEQRAHDDLNARRR